MGRGRAGRHWVSLLGRVSVTSMETICLSGQRERAEPSRREGVLCLKKGIDCGPTAAELWLSRANVGK